MYEIRDLQRLKIILEKITYIEAIVKKYSGISLALKDKEIAKPAILMHLIAMAEQFLKLKDPKFIELFSSAIKGSISIRNFIAHDYDGVNLSIVESTIREILPGIRKDISELFKEIK